MLIQVDNKTNIKLCICCNKCRKEVKAGPVFLVLKLLNTPVVKLFEVLTDPWLNLASLTYLMNFINSCVSTSVPATIALCDLWPVNEGVKIWDLLSHLEILSVEMRLSCLFYCKEFKMYKCKRHKSEQMVCFSSNKGIFHIRVCRRVSHVCVSTSD